MKYSVSTDNCCQTYVYIFGLTEIIPLRYVWVIMVWSFCQNWGYIMVVTMTPTFMEKVLHFNIKDVSFLIHT